MRFRRNISCCLALALLPVLFPLLFRGLMLLVAGPQSYTVLSSDAELPLHALDRLSLIGVWMIVGAWRMVLAWPFPGSKYLDWLRASPWSPGAPLPQGNFLPSTCLLLALALSTSIATLAFGQSLLLVPAAYLSGWLLAQSFISLHSHFRKRLFQNRNSSLPPFIVASALVTTTFTPWPNELAVLVMMASALWMHRELLKILEGHLRERELPQAGPSCHHISWLAAEEPQPGQRWRDRTFFALAATLSIGLLTAFLATSEYQSEGQISVTSSMTALLIAVFAIGSIIFHCSVLLPPLTIWGRIRTGRWVIPSYDRMLWPAISALALLGISYLVGRLVPPGMSQITIATIGNSLAIAVKFLLEPDRRTWALTAAGRMPPPMTSIKPREATYQKA